jgi:hypothetical protein
MKWQQRWAVISGGVLVTGIVAYYIVRTPNYDALKEQGNMLVHKLDAYHSAHGEYPHSLEGAQIKAPFTFFGHWHYKREAEDSFWLYVGDYGRDGFTLRYIPRRGWDLDT